MFEADPLNLLPDIRHSSAALLSPQKKSGSSPYFSMYGYQEKSTRSSRNAVGRVKKA
ncbi:hypothetical protein BDR05DRAFT_961129 [Suillus weaverae]|nr:hypothetical protein BDR05DRAFT_961129 [Suillus weaverae]